MPELDRYEVRPEWTDSERFAVVDRMLSISHGRGGLDREEAEALAAKLNKEHRVFDPPIPYRIRTNRGWKDGLLCAWRQRPDGTWEGEARTSKTGSWNWYPQTDLRDPHNGVYAAPRKPLT
jgi:hypothetical protein